MYSNRGVKEIRTLTITTASSTSENITITLNSIAYSIAVTNSGNIQRTVWEISQGNFNPHWVAFPSGATIIFVALKQGSASGIYSLTATTAVGTYVQTRAGAVSTDSFIAQTNWNGDTLDGTGTSQITANWQYGNVFQIYYQYLGYGSISCFVETISLLSNINQPTWTLVHTIKLPNTRTLTTLRVPSFQFNTSVTSLGSTTNVSVIIGSYAGFIEGIYKFNGNRFSFFNSLSAVGTTNIVPVLTIYNSLYFNSLVNWTVVNLLSTSCSLSSNNPAILYLIKNGTLGGNPNFTQYSSSSCIWYDISATTVTYPKNELLIWTGCLSNANGQMIYNFDSMYENLQLQPGEYVTLGLISLHGNATYASASLNVREDK